MKRNLLTILTIVIVTIANGQLSGTKNIPGDYTTLAVAITDLNTQGVGVGGVILNLVAGNPQTAPVGGYSITATGTLADQITIQGNGNTTTASGALTAGSLNDAIFKLIGADYVTINGFIIEENVANTNTNAATNSMTEWGVALLYASTTNGAQNNTIQNNTIDLDRTYQNTFGIYSNSTHSATAVTTVATATTTAGGNSGLKIYSNSITDVNTGIVVVGPTAAADNNDGLDIGGTAPTGNTITNYGTTGTFSGYANVSTTVNGILVRNTKNYNISYNTVTSSNGGTTSGTLRGIYVPNFSSTPAGTITNSVNNNIISVRSGLAAGEILGIDVELTTVNATTTLNINSNDFNNSGHTVAGSGAITFLSFNKSGITPGGALNTNINNNTFTNLSVNTTGIVTLISNNAERPANAVCNVNGNSIVTAFNKTSSGGRLQIYLSASVSPGTASEINSNNNFSNITVAGSTLISGWQSSDGDGTANSPSATITGNTFSNWTAGTGGIGCLNVGFSSIANVSNNIISNISTGGGITAISAFDGTINIFSNTINTLSATSGVSAVTGILVSNNTQNVYKNRIYDLQNNNATGTVNGIRVSGGTNVTIYNNLIGDLRAPSTNGVTDAIRGINLTSTTPSSNLNIYYNTIYINATSTGVDFSTAGIFHTTSANATTAALNLRNNIIVNNSTPNGTGLTVAYRRSSTIMTNYTSASNNNLFYAGTPGASNLIFFDGTNSEQTLSGYKTSASTRDGASVTEDPAFLSTTGSSPNFLHINTTVASQAESAAAPISGVADDYNGDARHISTPDIGADEFNGIVQDLTAPSIFYTPVPSTCSFSNATLSNVIITDASGVPISGSFVPRIYYKKNTGLYFSRPGTFISGSATNGNWSFTIEIADIGGVTNNDIISYYIIAQDMGSPFNIGSNSYGVIATDVNIITSHPPTPNTYSTGLNLSGTVNVGVGQIYATLTAAVNAYNTACSLTGPVVFSLIDATYPSETFPITINANAFASSTNTLTIMPASGVAVIVSGNSSSNALIDLNGADYVTINGVNSGGSTLTIRNTNNTTATIRLINDATNNTIQNTVIEGAGASVIHISFGVVTGNDNNTISNNTVRDRSDAAGLPGYLIFSSGTSSTVTNGTINISSNILKNYSNVAIGLFGTGAANGNENWNINDNEILQESVRTTPIWGIVFSAIGTNIIEQNYIHDLNSTSQVIGILLDDARSTTVSMNKVVQVTVAGSIFLWMGIYVNGSNGNPVSVTIVNNMVSLIPTTNTSQSIYGIRVLGFAGHAINVYFNTVLIGGTATGSFTRAFGRSTSSPTICTVKDNIFFNNRTGGLGSHFAISDQSLGLGTFTSNYNLLVGTGSTAANFFERGGTPMNFASWQATTGTPDLNSLAANPGGNYSLGTLFVSATDLHIQTNNFVVNGLGVTIGGITTDFDGNIRSTPPTIGADEVTVCLITSWTGAVNTAWENPANWSCGVPTSTTDVIIPGGAIVIINGSAHARSLTASPTANITVNSGFSLTIHN